jgi:hypothetical protein
MNAASPDLLTLLHWATQLADDQRCAEWEAWCAASPDAAGKWERITQAQELLDGGVSVAEETAFSAETLAEYVEGRLDRAEAVGLKSSLAIAGAACRAASSVRFASRTPQAEAVPLKAGPLFSSDCWRSDRSGSMGTSRRRRCYRLAPAAAKIAAPKDRPMTAIIVPDPFVLLPYSAGPGPLAVAGGGCSAMVVFLLSGAIGWLTCGRREAGNERPIAKSPKLEEPAPPQHEKREEPPPVIPADVIPQDKRPKEPPQPPPLEFKVVPPAKRSEPVASELDNKQPAPLPVREAPPARVPQPPSRRSALPPAPELAFQSAQGILLSDAGSRGTWRVATGQHALREPLKLASLAESWTTAEVPGVATLVCEGSTELALRRLIDGVLEIRLDRGRVGIRELADGAEVPCWRAMPRGPRGLSAFDFSRLRSAESGHRRA